jgi:hypothetical protein
MGIAYTDGIGCTTITSTAFELSANEYRKQLLKEFDGKKSYTQAEIKDIINETLFRLIFLEY